MLPLALRDPVSLCNMPFAIFMPRTSFKIDFAQPIGQHQGRENSVRMKGVLSENQKLWVSAPSVSMPTGVECNERGNQ